MEKMTFRMLLVVTFMLGAQSLYCQNVIVRATFHHDSVRVGDEVPFSLTATYPITEQILFPDSSFDYSPLEYRRKEYFRTRSSKTTSYDSVVYYLSSFEVDRVQRFSLPVFLLTEKDCTVFVSNRDSILMQQLVSELPDSLRSIPVRASVAWLDPELTINYPLIIIGYGSVVFLAIILWIMFGERLRKHMRLKKLRKAHAAFLSAFDTHISASSKFSARETEAALVVWKRYMEQLSPWPYTKLTTPETVRIEKDESLAKSLRSIDAAIYGNASPEQQSLQALKGYADRRFNHKIQEVING